MGVAERLPELRAWYRDALTGRLESLDGAVRDLLEGVAAGPPSDGPERASARAVVRSQAHALAGSGGSYGFPLLSEGARFVEHASRERLVPAAVGLTDLVRDVVRSVEERADRRCHGWLDYALGPLPPGTESRLVPGPPTAVEARAIVRTALGDPDGDLTGRIAERLGLGVADLDTPGDAASLLVPPRLALDHGVLPLREDGASLWAAAANPTDLRAMLALHDMTGRAPILEPAPPGLLREALDRAYGPRSGVRRGPRGREAHAGPGRILVADDDPGARLFLRAILEKGGFDVVEATDGFEVLDALASDAVDLVVLDLHMPRMDGAAVVREIRSGETRPDMPTIVVTGVEDADTELALIEAGADDYLRKPVEPRLFLARVRSTLRRLEASPGAT